MTEQNKHEAKEFFNNLKNSKPEIHNKSFISKKLKENIKLRKEQLVIEDNFFKMLFIALVILLILSITSGFFNLEVTMIGISTEATTTSINLFTFVLKTAVFLSILLSAGIFSFKILKN
ncbi:MAG: hypothetical protein ACQESP_07285 [Candidatus Muiribacteriota bacterium]